MSIASAERPAAQPADLRAAAADDILEAPLSRGAELLSPPDNDAESTADHATAEPTFGRDASAEGPVIEHAELQAQPADEQLEAPLRPGAELVNPPEDEGKEAADHAPAEPTSEASVSATPAPRPKLSLAALTSTRSWLGGMAKLGQRREGNRTYGLPKGFQASTPAADPDVQARHRRWLDMLSEHDWARITASARQVNPAHTPPLLMDLSAPFRVRVCMAGQAARHPGEQVGTLRGGQVAVLLIPAREQAGETT